AGVQTCALPILRLAPGGGQDHDEGQARRQPEPIAPRRVRHSAVRSGEGLPAKKSSISCRFCSTTLLAAAASSCRSHSETILKRVGTSARRSVTADGVFSAHRQPAGAPSRPPRPWASRGCKKRRRNVSTGGITPCVGSVRKKRWL